MAEILVGYARCSTTSQDVCAQLSALKQLGVTDEHLHTDRGRTGGDRERPGLTAALGAVRAGDVLVVTKLDRLGRSARDLHDIAAELAGKGVKLSIGGSIHDPGDPIGKMFFGMLALMAEFESDLIRRAGRLPPCALDSTRRCRERRALPAGGSVRVVFTRPPPRVRVDAVRVHQVVAASDTPGAGDSATVLARRQR